MHILIIYQMHMFEFTLVTKISRRVLIFMAKIKHLLTNFATTISYNLSKICLEEMMELV